MTHTTETIKEKVSKDPRWATRALIALYQRQTTDEQASERTIERNGQGFNGIDAEILSSFANQVLAGRTLSQKQLAIAFKKLPKYSKQLLAIASTN